MWISVNIAKLVACLHCDCHMMEVSWNSVGHRTGLALWSYIFPLCHQLIYIYKGFSNKINEEQKRKRDGSWKLKQNLTRPLILYVPAVMPTRIRLFNKSMCLWDFWRTNKKSDWGTKDSQDKWSPVPFVARSPGSLCGTSCASNWHQLLLGLWHGWDHFRAFTNRMHTSDISSLKSTTNFKTML